MPDDPQRPTRHDQHEDLRDDSAPPERTPEEIAKGIRDILDRYAHGPQESELWYATVEGVERKVRAAITAERDRLEDLLVILHGDGGHYTGNHGLEKSIEDAKTLIYKLFASGERADRLVAECRGWRSRHKAMMEAGVSPYPWEPLTSACEDVDFAGDLTPGGQGEKH